MPAFDIRERLIPYRVLTYLLYSTSTSFDWLEKIESKNGNKVRINTGDAARSLRLKNAALWDLLYWLRDQKLIKVEKEEKRGTAIITLKQPTNIKGKT